MQEIRITKTKNGQKNFPREAKILNSAPSKIGAWYGPDQLYNWRPVLAPLAVNSSTTVYIYTLVLHNTPVNPPSPLCDTS